MTVAPDFANSELKQPRRAPPHSPDRLPPDRARPRILIATDAYKPQVNGVSRTLQWLEAEAPAIGVEMEFLTPVGYPTIGAPTYPELRLALADPASIARRIEAADPDAVHIATEGPIGFLVRRHCLRVGRRFTTCYHTRFPEYLAARWIAPASWSYAALRHFHNAAAVTMVSTPRLKAELERRGFGKLVLWRRGIPVQQFISRLPAQSLFPKPVFLYVGRVAIEKNLDAFLALDLPGTKVVVGNGPARDALARKYPSARFLGRLDGAQLAAAYASADAFVFPSLTDTFGLVMLEALTAGVPVAAFPVTAPLDVLGESGCGVTDFDLRRAALSALEIPREKCKAFGARHAMRESARAFVANVANAVGLKWSLSALQAAG